MNAPLEHAVTRQLFDPDVLVDPFAWYQDALGRGAVHEVAGAGMWLVLSYAAVAEATGRVDEFSNDFSAILSGQRSEQPEVKAELERGWPQVDTLLTADPPVHTRFRKLVNLAFSMKRVNAIEERMRAIVVDLIDGFADAGVGDFVRDFAVPLPVAMIAGELGLPDEERPRVKRWSDAFVDRLGHMISPEREIQCAREVVEFQHALKDQIDERRERPTDDLLSDLVNARVDDERPLSDAELLSIIQQLMVAGNETTTSALAGGLLQLIRNSDQMAKAVTAAGGADAKAVGNLVEEVLRTESPTSGMWRRTTREAELDGTTISAGAMVHLRYASANRDPAKFDDPDRFDMERSNARAHLAFGRGIHMCVGNMLSRKEMAVAFDELLSRLTDFAVVDESAVAWPPNMLLRGLTTLPITFRRV